MISMAILDLNYHSSTNLSNTSSNNLTNKINLDFSIKSDFEWPNEDFWESIYRLFS